MANLVLRKSLKYQPIKNGAGLHGADIGTIGVGTLVIVDKEKLHDGWTPIAGPEGLGPTWRGTGQQGWIEFANTSDVNENSHQYLLTIATDGRIISCTQIN